jgi:hypothetical protein
MGGAMSDSFQQFITAYSTPGPYGISPALFDFVAALAVLLTWILMTRAK